MQRLVKMLGKSKRGKAGFTLIELMIVVIIVGILAAAAVPIYTSYVRRSYRAEAEASLGAIRTAELTHKAEHGVFTDDWTALDMSSDDFAYNRYFSWACFVVSATADTFEATCTGSASEAGGSNPTTEAMVVTMDQAGAVLYSP